MTHRIQIEGSAESVEAEPGDTILDALLMGGVGFPYSCQAGNCGNCKCELVDGEIQELEYSEHALSADERARGSILACRSQIWSDVRIRKLDEEAFVVHPSRVMQCRVVALEPLTHDIHRLQLDIVSGGPFTFSAGQYASLSFPFAPDRPRHFSMASRPDESWLEFHIREGATGTLCHGLAERLTVGDIVRVAGPEGGSYLRERHDGPVLVIAGGSGFAPIRSILGTLRARGLRNPVHAYFGARAERDVYGESELRSWTEGQPQSAVHVVLSVDEGHGRRHGFVTDAVAVDFDRLDGFKAYVAGPPAMVEAAVDLLQRKGMALRDIHTDLPVAVVGPTTVLQENS